MESNERIIGTCLEVNSDIIRMRFEDNKSLKLFIKLRETYFRNKLIKSVNKLGKANIPLTKENLIELFSYIFSNFPPQGAYKDILQVLHISKPGYKLWKATIKFTDDILYIVDIKDDEETFTVSVVVNDRDTKEKNRTDIYLKELKTDKAKMVDYIDTLNDLLIKNIMSYILEIINSTKNVERKKNEV